MFVFIKSVLIIIGCVIGGGLFGFFGTFTVAQFLPENPAYSFLTFYTVPFGMLIGLILGLYLAFK